MCGQFPEQAAHDFAAAGFGPGYRQLGLIISQLSKSGCVVFARTTQSFVMPDNVIIIFSLRAHHFSV
jgi:hypothetical protein